MMVSFFNTTSKTCESLLYAISKACKTLLLYIHMKTLYESILDIDAPGRLENDVKTGIKRQKLIQEILGPIEHIIKTYRYSTQGIKSNYADVYGLSGGVSWYELTSQTPSMRDKSGVGTLQNILKKDYRKYKPMNKDNSNSSVFPTSQFTFEDLGIAIFIRFLRNRGVDIRLCYRANDKQVGKHVQDIVDKYTEPF